MANKYGYSSKSLGKCLTEYKVITFDDIVKDCHLFFVLSQYRNVSNWNLEQFDNANIPSQTSMPKCGVGQQVFGVRTDRSIVRLMSIVDSSD